MLLKAALFYTVVDDPTQESIAVFKVTVVNTNRNSSETCSQLLAFPSASEAGVTVSPSQFSLRAQQSRNVTITFPASRLDDGGGSDGGGDGEGAPVRLEVGNKACGTRRQALVPSLFPGGGGKAGGRAQSATGMFLIFCLVVVVAGVAVSFYRRARAAAPDQEQQGFLQVR